MPLSSGIDDAWPTRLPQGWTQLPDGSYGPSSAIPDWLKQLIPSPGASTPNAPGGALGPYSGGPQGLMPGGGMMGYSGATPGAPSMGFPAQGGPQVMPPQNSTIPPNKSVGPFTGGTSTEGSYYDPRTWFKANPNATFQQGQPMGPDVAGGAASPLSFLARGNPAWRAALAAGAVMAPTPAETGELPLSLSGARPQHPASTGAMPQPNMPSNMPSRPYSPTPQNYPSWPTPGVTGPAATMANAPPGNPSDTPRPARPATGMGGRYGYSRMSPQSTPSAPAKPASNPRFGTFQYQIPGSGGGPLSRSPIYTALNLFGGKS
jgi:hypothetical protein